jgi:hypothetical protein
MQVKLTAPSSTPTETPQPYKTVCQRKGTDWSARL